MTHGTLQKNLEDVMINDISQLYSGKRFRIPLNTNFPEPSIV